MYFSIFFSFSNILHSLPFSILPPPTSSSLVVSRHIIQSERRRPYINTIMASRNTNNNIPQAAASGRFTDQDVIDTNQRLLNSIAACDFKAYKELTAEDITAIEPESQNHPIHGTAFHKYYFDLYQHTHFTSKVNEQPIIPNVITMSNPHVRWLGGGCCSDGCGEGTAAIITYVRLDQTMTTGDDAPKIITTSETRVWENRDGTLVNVHFHKSGLVNAC